MIVVMIMALIAAAVGTAVIPRFVEAQNQTARTDGHTVASAAEQYLVVNPGRGCPSTAELAEAGFLSAQTRVTDPWDQEFLIACSSGGATVTSIGRNGQRGTEDDVR